MHHEMTYKLVVVVYASIKVDWLYHSLLSWSEWRLSANSTGDGAAWVECCYSREGECEDCSGELHGGVLFNYDVCTD